MISLHLRDKNQIINMTIPGKAPLQGRSAHSPYYHNSLDFLCAALGICAGGNIVHYCRFNDINAQMFESIEVAYTDSQFIITIKRPEDFIQDHMDKIEKLLKNCAVAKELTASIEVRWAFNEQAITELIKEPKGCCGQ
jgi:hypothetical protein